MSLCILIYGVKCIQLKIADVTFVKVTLKDYLFFNFNVILDVLKKRYIREEI